MRKAEVGKGFFELNEFGVEVVVFCVGDEGAAFVVVGDVVTGEAVGKGVDALAGLGLRERRVFVGHRGGGRRREEGRLGWHLGHRRSNRMGCCGDRV